jgi:hypothetical protein
MTRAAILAIGAPMVLATKGTVREALGAGNRARGVVVLLPSADLDTVMTTSLVRLLPEKATSFQPKPSIGVFMRSLRDESVGH